MPEHVGIAKWEAAFSEIHASSTRLPSASWADLAQAAFKKQLEPKEKTPVAEGLSKARSLPLKKGSAREA